MGLLTTFQHLEETQEQEMTDDLADRKMPLPSTIDEIMEVKARVVAGLQAAAERRRHLLSVAYETRDAHPREILYPVRVSEQDAKTGSHDLYFPYLLMAIPVAKVVPKDVIDKLKKLNVNVKWLEARSAELSDEQQRNNKRLIAIAAENRKTKETAGATIDKSKVPDKVMVVGRSGKGFDNPYWDKHANSSTRFAGDPDVYDFGTQAGVYYQLQHMLKTYNLAPFTLCYASTIGARTQLFIVYGANGDVVWRKYGTGMNANNIVYLKGVPVKTSTLSYSTAAAETILRNTGVIK